MFVFLPQDRSDFVYTKCKLVSKLEEKVQGLEKQVSTLRCIRENEDFLDRCQDILLQAQHSEGSEQTVQRGQKASEENWQHVTSRRRKRRSSMYQQWRYRSRICHIPGSCHSDPRCPTPGQMALWPRARRVNRLPHTSPPGNVQSRASPGSPTTDMSGDDSSGSDSAVPADVAHACGSWEVASDSWQWATPCDDVTGSVVSKEWGVCSPLSH
ncbi:unnamed protein product [Caretta caretta]